MLLESVLASWIYRACSQSVLGDFIAQRASGVMERSRAVRKSLLEDPFIQSVWRTEANIGDTPHIFPARLHIATGRDAISIIIISVTYCVQAVVIAVSSAIRRVITNDQRPVEFSLSYISNTFICYFIIIISIDCYYYYYYYY